MRKQTIIFLVFLFSLFTPFIPLTPVKGISFTYTRYWFYIEQQGIIDYKDMQFTVRNNQEHSVEILCRFQEIEGINIDVIFDWNRINVSSGETVINNYKINISSEFSTVFNLEFYLHEKPVGGLDSQLTTGGIITNKVVYYSSEEGSLLTLDIADQTETPREAQVTIRYSVNDSMPYTTIKEFNGSRFYGVLPYGDYRVYAYDLDSNVYAEQKFILNSTEHNLTVKLNLVGFGIFKLIPRGTVGVETTIFNHVGEIESVKIYAELYYKGQNNVLTTSEPFVISPLPKTTSQKITLWLGYSDWEYNRGYIVRGVLEAGGVPIAFKWSEGFSIPPPEEEPATISLEFVLLVIVIIAFISYFSYVQLSKQSTQIKLTKFLDKFRGTTK